MGEGAGAVGAGAYGELIGALGAYGELIGVGAYSEAGCGGIGAAAAGVGAGAGVPPWGVSGMAPGGKNEGGGFVIWSAYASAEGEKQVFLQLFYGNDRQESAGIGHISENCWASKPIFYGWLGCTLAYIVHEQSRLSTNHPLILLVCQNPLFCWSARCYANMHNAITVATVLR